MTFATNENIIVTVTGTGNSIEYTLYADNVVVFKGKAYSRTTNFQIDLTDIVLPLIERPSIPAVGSTSTYTPINFTLTAGTSNVSFIVFPYNVFDKTKPTTWNNCNHLNNKVAADAPYLSGSYTSTNGSIQATDVSSQQSVGGNKVICSDKPTLYWENLEGGYDSIILSEIKKTLGKTAYSYNAYGRGPSSIGTHHKVNYINEGTITYKVSTPYMSDNDSERFNSIVFSNRAWLWMNGKYYAVNVNTTSLECKKHRTDKMYSYNVDLELSEVIINY